ncbi:glycosyltransferase family 29-domain-containing protein [Pavlovales sp. CCMP2436]|nr:glycosyltransferase family 29-domain-containing protein [Pavlovales sp. CCMP2436]
MGECAFNITLGGVPAALRTRLRDAFGRPAGFQSCAVVGSAGTLLASDFGAEIDRAELVIRFNGAPTASFEAHVGSRTTVSVRNGQSLMSWCTKTARCPTERVFVREARAPWAQRLASLCGRPGAEVLQTPTWLTKQAGRLVTAAGAHAPRAIPTGMLGIVLAAALCPHGLSAYGYSTLPLAGAPVQGSEEARTHFHYYANFSRPAKADNVPAVGAQLRALASREQASCIVIREPATSVRVPTSWLRLPPAGERGRRVACEPVRLAPKERKRRTEARTRQKLQAGSREVAIRQL